MKETEGHVQVYKIISGTKKDLVRAILGGSVLEPTWAYFGLESTYLNIRPGPTLNIWDQGQHSK